MMRDLTATQLSLIASPFKIATWLFEVQIPLQIGYGITWTSRTSAANNDWRSVTYGNGLFVAVAATGTNNHVMTSPDGITWTSRTSAANNVWYSVTYGNGLFVAVAITGTNNRVMTSPDGITWTSRTSAADNSWYSVTYGNGLFVAVAFSGTNNHVMTSPDGITWTLQTSAADIGWHSVTYGNGLFVAVAFTGTNNRVMTSPGDDVFYYWSTKNVTYGEQEYEYRIASFDSLVITRSNSENGVQAPNLITFQVLNNDDALTDVNFNSKPVIIKLVISDGEDTEIIRSWKFITKSACESYSVITFQCEDFLQEFLDSDFPNQLYAADLFPATDASVDNTFCIPVIFGTAYVPLVPAYVSGDGKRYYVLGPADITYTASAISTPQSITEKTEWESPAYTFNQYTKTDPIHSIDWKVLEPIIADVDEDGTVDSIGLWLFGSSYSPAPVKFTRDDTTLLTNPADIIKYVLEDIGVAESDIDSDSGSSFEESASTYESSVWDLTFNGGFFYKKKGYEVISELLNSCHSTLKVTDKIELSVLSKTSKKTITSSDIISQQEGRGSLVYSPILQMSSDSGYVAFAKDGEPQTNLVKVLVPVKSVTDRISEEIVIMSFINDAINAQSAACLYYQRRFLKIAEVQFKSKGTLLAIEPDDIITVDDPIYGDAYRLLVESMTINKDCSINFVCSRFKEDLDDWEDLAFSNVVISTDLSSAAWTPVISGPDTETPSSGQLPNALRGRVRIGETGNYILLDPAEPIIKLVEGGTERVLIGDLGVNDYGIQINDFNGATVVLINDTVSQIAGWHLSTDRLSSDTSGARIELNKANNRISIFDDVNEKVTIGYLEGLVRTGAHGTATSGGNSTLTDTAKDWRVNSLAGLDLVLTSGTGSGQTKTIVSNTSTVITISGTWTTNPSSDTGYEVRYISTNYGFWARDGDTLSIDADVDYESGNLGVFNDASIRIFNSAGNEIIRLGTDTGEKGLFLYNTAGTKLAKFNSGEVYIGVANNYMSYTVAGGLVISGGGITFNSTNGFIKGGQTAYNTGTGFFLGYSGAAYKLSIGTSGGNYVTWDGSVLTIKGAITASTVTSSTFIGGVARNSGSTNIIDFDATGTTSFLKVASNVDIKADGTGVFQRLLITEPIVANYGTYSVTCSMGDAQFWIPTGIIDHTTPWYTSSNTSYIGRVRTGSGARCSDHNLVLWNVESYISMATGFWDGTGNEYITWQGSTWNQDELGIVCYVRKMNWSSGCGSTCATAERFTNLFWALMEV